MIKHDVHGFEVDKPGEDTWRLRQAGAHKVLIANATRLTLMVYRALALANTPLVFPAACDMPLLDPALVGLLRTWPSADADALLPVRDGRLEPMHAVYGHRCLGAIEEALLSGEYRMPGWFGAVRMEPCAEEAWRAIDPEGRFFRNVNTQDELLAVEAVGSQA